ncbi:hypothetical protein CO615_04160 [Lysobacteraceae bacterium NML75-0749]|nr:hypothetical protein CO615_04160 [Xanthomonadaceae bacterium NML75-0749]
MAFLGQSYNLAAIDPQRDFGAIPSGEYLVMIVDSDMKATKAGTGQYLELTHEILEGPYKGQKLWARLNLINPNQQAVSIAQSQLSAIGHAINVLNPSDSQELHNRPMIARVEFVKADGERTQRDSNEIKAWKRYDGAAQMPSAAAPQPQAQAPAPAQAAPSAAQGGLPPWKRDQAA